MIILRNCKLVGFLTEGYEGECADILCDGDKIVKIAACGTDFGVKAEEMDIQGKTVLPGLIDMHCHLFLDEMGVITGGKDQLVPDMKWGFNAYEYATAFLDAGFTTLRDVGDMPCRPAMHLKNEINAGRLAGPNIKTSGPTLEGTYCDCKFHIGADGPYEFRKIVRNNLKGGSDFIKLYGSGSLLMPSNEPGFPIVEPDEVQTAVDIAKRWGTYVAVHAHGKTAIDICVKAGVHTIEHASLISEETLQYIESLPFGEIGIVPTMYAFADIVKDKDSYNGKRAIALVDQIKDCLKNAYFNHKVLIGWGSDVALVDFVKAPMEEFKLRKEWLDYSNEDILKQATINSAILMHMENQVGSVKEGKLADLIVVDGDPVADITVMYNKPLHVIKSGVVIR